MTETVVPTASQSQSQPPPPSFNFDAVSIPMKKEQQQIGNAILNLHGTILSSSSSVPSSSSKLQPSTKTYQLLYQIFVEVGLLQLPSFRRIVIKSTSTQMQVQELPQQQQDEDQDQESSNEIITMDGTNSTTTSNLKFIMTRDETQIYILVIQEL